MASISTGPPRIQSLFIRNLSESNLLIPGRHIQLVNIVGQGMYLAYDTIDYSYHLIHMHNNKTHFCCIIIIMP